MAHKIPQTTDELGPTMWTKLASRRTWPHLWTKLTSRQTLPHDVDQTGQQENLVPRCGPNWPTDKLGPTCGPNWPADELCPTMWTKVAKRRTWPKLWTQLANRRAWSHDVDQTGQQTNLAPLVVHIVGPSSSVGQECGPNWTVGCQGLHAGEPGLRGQRFVKLMFGMALYKSYQQLYIKRGRG